MAVQEDSPTKPTSAGQLDAGSPCGIVCLLLILVFVLGTRFWALGDKPFHHDESMFAERAYLLQTTGDYEYNRILHGPFLEDVSALIFMILGDSDVTARLWCAIAGTLLLLAVWQLRDRLGNLAAFWAVALLAISPTLLFYSRFNRNDVPFTLAAMASVFCVVRFLQKGCLRYWFLALLSVGWMVCIEEIYVIFLFITITFVVGIGLVETAAGRSSSLREAVKRVAGQRRHFGFAFAVVTAAGLAAALFLIVLLFTTFFRHLDHAHGAIEAIRYWAGQHAEHRIYGEFHYYLPILLIYEFLPLALLVWGVGRTLRRTAWLRGWVAWGWAAWSAALLAVLWPYTFSDEFARLAHMTRGWHLWLAVEVLALGAAACAALTLEGRRLEAFFLWWTLGSFLSYSYAGEKVPWISIHVVFPMIVTAALFAQEIVRSARDRTANAFVVPASAGSFEEFDRCNSSVSLREGHRALAADARSSFGRALVSAFLAAGFVATGAVALRLSFVNSANPAERHVYTHTTPDYKAMVAEIQDIVARADGRPADRFPLIVEGDSLWPAQWYFRRWQTMRSGPISPAAPIVVLDEYLDPNHREAPALTRYPWLLQTHAVRRVPFREWWHQEPLMATFGRLFDIWLALVPKQYRRARLTDPSGQTTGLVADRDGLRGMTIADEVRASEAAWRAIYDYLVYRRDFDPYKSPYPTRAYMSVLFCVQKDLYKKWTRLGGRHSAARSRFVR
jgi:uncharacterized protein (TIGR03663 family)